MHPASGEDKFFSNAIGVLQIHPCMISHKENFNQCAEIIYGIFTWENKIGVRKEGRAEAGDGGRHVLSMSEVLGSNSAPPHTHKIKKLKIKRKGN